MRKGGLSDASQEVTQSRTAVVIPLVLSDLTQRHLLDLDIIVRRIKECIMSTHTNSVIYITSSSVLSMRHS
jgi:hypothetical protein